MAPPRATVEQAVEFLKFHQLRKENSALHQKVVSVERNIQQEQAERNITGEVLKTVLSEVEKLKESHVVQTRNIESLQYQLAKFDQLSSNIQTSVSDLKSDVEKDIADERSLRSRLEQADEQHEERLAKLTEMFREGNMTIKSEIATMNEQLELKTSLAETVNVKERLSILEETVEQMHDRDDPANAFDDNLQNARRERPDPDALTSDLSQSLHIDHFSPCKTPTSDNREDLMLSSEQPRLCSEVDAVEEQQAYNATRAISYIDHETSSGLPECLSPKTASLPLTSGTMIDALLSLRQGSREKASKYLERVESFRRSLPSRFEILFLTRFVEGISGPEKQGLAKRWLDNSGWTIVNLRDSIDFFESRVAKSGEGDTENASTDEASNNTGLAESGTAGSNIEPVPPDTELTSPAVVRSPNLNPHSQRTELRRSQRIQNVQTENLQQRQSGSKEQPSRQRSKQVRSQSNDEPAWMRPRDAKGRFRRKKKTNLRHRRNIDREVSPKNTASKNCVPA